MHVILLDSLERVRSTKSCWNQEAELDQEEELERPLTPINLRTPTPVEADDTTYEEQIDKYGWIAEVHGDPFNLK